MIAKIGFDTAEKGPFKVWDRKMMQNRCPCDGSSLIGDTSPQSHAARAQGNPGGAASNHGPGSTMDLLAERCGYPQCCVSKPFTGFLLVNLDF